MTYNEVLAKRLAVMDSAIALARDNGLPIIVFSLDEAGGFRGILNGKVRTPRFPSKLNLHWKKLRSQSTE